MGKELEPLAGTLGGPSGRGAPKVLDLFSGIGGFALAFEAAGFETVAFAEIEPYPCKVLAQHWPQVPNLGDVRAIDGEAYRGAIDVVCGGFPCQDISTAGKGAGIHGARSGLWFEMLRIIRGSRPAFCLLENVPALRTRGVDDVLGGLEEAGYACRPFVVGAVHAGAPHRRQRVWVVAYAKGARFLRAEQLENHPSGERGRESPNDLDPVGQISGPDVADADRLFGSRDWDAIAGDGGRQDGPGAPLPGRCGSLVAHAGREGLEEREGPAGERPRAATPGGDWWATEPAMGRVAHGVPHRAHRIKALGNSIVPAVAYPFAQWIYNVLMARSTPEAASAGGSP
jgi:DNA (cytosine-5)-methyltransferase 1